MLLRQQYGDRQTWPQQDPAWPLPAGLQRGSDSHLAYLTLVYAISGGRDAVFLWRAARESFAADPELFDPRFLAYTQPAAIQPRLQSFGLLQKPRTEATVWQRIGQALVMRAGGSVLKLLSDHDYDASRLMAMLARSKSTFPVLSGPQTAPRWLYGLASIGQQPIQGAADLPVLVSPAARRVLEELALAGETVPAATFDRLEAWGRSHL